MKPPHILVVSLGGTIMMARSAGGGITPTLTAADLLRAVAGIDAIAAIEIASPMSKPSASLTIDDVLALAAMIDERLDQNIDGVVLIQGTETTIEETAFVLDLVVRSHKPVLSLAMRVCSLRRPRSRAQRYGDRSQVLRAGNW